jgi:hypothetical protein
MCALPVTHADLQPCYPSRMRTPDVRRKPRETRERSGEPQGLRLFSLNTPQGTETLPRSRSKPSQDGKRRDPSPVCSSSFGDGFHRTCIRGDSIGSFSINPVDSGISGGRDGQDCSWRRAASSPGKLLPVAYSSYVGTALTFRQHPAALW